MLRCLHIPYAPLCTLCNAPGDVLFFTQYTVIRHLFRNAEHKPPVLSLFFHFRKSGLKSSTNHMNQMNQMNQTNHTNLADKFPASLYQVSSTKYLVLYISCMQPASYDLTLGHFLYRTSAPFAYRKPFPIFLRKFREQQTTTIIIIILRDTCTLEKCLHRLFSSLSAFPRSSPTHYCMQDQSICLPYLQPDTAIVGNPLLVMCLQLLLAHSFTRSNRNS